MSPVSTARRISYVIPPPTQPIPRLVLPRPGADRHGITTPLLIPENAAKRTDSVNSDNLDYLEDVIELSTPPTSTLDITQANQSNANSSVLTVGSISQHPKHRLGVTSFALDTSTMLSGKPRPEGILYSGGRDGMVIAHELGASLRQRSKPYGSEKVPGRSWESVTGWRDNYDYDQDHDLDTDTDDYGADVPGHGRGPGSLTSSIPFEDSWELDLSSGEPTVKCSFRQSVQCHSDWVNDILLCNFNRTLISCSSDGTVKAWSPHDPEEAMDPTVLGRHSDYVRCLAHPRHQKWVVSGSFDRTIKLWDLSNKRQEPAVMFTPPDAGNTKASVYALATDAAGSLVASGGPEKVVRLWDPRTGKRTGKLVGHTDNIRSILLSDDGRYILTGSADASIKLWSVASSHRCLHTFEHHTESVWSMHSSHPSLSIFYSGDRAGNVCRVDVDGCASLSEGECILLCKEAPSVDALGSEGINKIAVLDDQFVWTATASSTINCWKAPGSRNTRISQLSVSLNETEQEGVSTSPSTLIGSSAFGFSHDPLQSVTLRSRHRESFGADKDGWIRSESPISTAETPSRRIESPIGHSIRYLHKSSPSANANFFDSTPNSNVSDTSLPNAPGGPGVSSPPQAQTASMFGIAYQSLIKLASPTDGFVSPSLIRPKEADVATLYSAASVKSVPAPVRQFIRTQTEPPSAKSPIMSPQQHQALNSVLRRSMASADGITFGTAMSAKHGFAGPAYEDAEDIARIAYESRDVAADAIPVQARPECSIQGTEGIVRSVVLNDRWHALTIDTKGQVCVWDIVRGVCVGIFERSQVEEAGKMQFFSDNHSGNRNGNDKNKGKDKSQWKWSPREALDMVKERIEGEAVVHSWCTVDSSIGNLMVHIQSLQAFDAEIFADEAGYEPGQFGFEEDFRLNIGKWVLGNLFAPFVAQEQQVQMAPTPAAQGGILNDSNAMSPPSMLSPANAPTAYPHSYPSRTGGIFRQGGPGHISLESRRVRSITEISASQRTPGISAALSTAPLTPAVLPHLPPDALDKIVASIIAEPDSAHVGHSTQFEKEKDVNQGKENDSENRVKFPDVSPSIGSPTPRVPVRSQTLDTTTGTTGHHDYFSLRKRSISDAEKPDQAAASTALSPPITIGISPQANEASITTAAAGTGISGNAAAPTVTTPAALGPLTPGTSSVSAAATSLKFMGKLKAFGKHKKAEVAGEITENAAPQASNPTEAEKVVEVKPPEPSLVEVLLSKPLNLPTLSEVPPVSLNPMTSIFISQASSEAASGWSPVYRGLFSTQMEDEDLYLLEHELPDWLVEFLLANKVNGVMGGGGVPGQKFSFMVVPWKGDSEGEEYLPDLLSSQSRLTASKFLRIRKVLGYVKDKVDSIELATRKREELAFSSQASLETHYEREKERDLRKSPSSRSLRRDSRSSHEAPPLFKPQHSASSTQPTHSSQAVHQAPPIPPIPEQPQAQSVQSGQSKGPATTSILTSSSPPANAQAPIPIPSGPPHPHGPRPRPISSSSTRSSASGYHGHHHGTSRRRQSRATPEEEKEREREKDKERHGKERLRPEDVYELLCCGEVLPNNMTLAAVKQFRWKNSAAGAEIVLEYRRKRR